MKDIDEEIKKFVQEAMERDVKALNEYTQNLRYDTRINIEGEMQGIWTLLEAEETQKKDEI